MPFLTAGACQLEYEWIEPAGASGPTIVMLHEGLGSLAMWRDFPSRLADATGCATLVYSRQGYGRSAALQGPRRVRYMHDEALVVLPQLLDELRIRNPVLFGHSDGASIALIHAGGSGRTVAAVIALAPHVVVEDISVTSIAAARRAYETTDLRERLARYHENVDGAFWGWNDIWLSAEFRSWDIGDYLPEIRCGILAIQGEDDEYGTMAQIERIASAAPHVELVRLAACRHSPHRDQPAAVLDSVTRFLQQPTRVSRDDRTAGFPTA
jgi:pimeloyl-ACP methyl ester carboxylesterase